MTLLISIFIYVLLFSIFLKSRNSLSYISMSTFPLFLSLYEVYEGGKALERESLLILALIAVWFVGFYFYSFHEKELRNKLYWSLWSVLIYTLSSIQTELTLYWINISVGVFYLIFQSSSDTKMTQRLILSSFGVDIFFLVLSPTILSPDNQLLVSPSYVSYLEILLRFLVPFSLSLKIIGLHKCLIEGKRNEHICTAEIFFITLLLFYKFSFGFSLDRTGWYLISCLFMLAGGLIFLKSFLNKSLQFHSVLSLFLLNMSAYISLISFYEIDIFQLLVPLAILYIQRSLFKHQHLSAYSPMLSIFSILIFTIMGSIVNDGYFHFSLLLAISSYLMWIYKNNIFFRRSYVS